MAAPGGGTGGRSRCTSTPYGPLSEVRRIWESVNKGEKPDVDEPATGSDPVHDLGNVATGSWYRITPSSIEILYRFNCVDPTEVYSRWVTVTPTSSGGLDPTVTPPDLIPLAWARAQRQLPTPVPRIAPSDLAPDGFAFVQAKTFFWVDQAAGQWEDVSATASLAGLSLTVTVVPELLVVTTGDGTTLQCPGAPPPFPPGADPDTFDGCGHVYEHSSATAAERGDLPGDRGDRLARDVAGVERGVRRSGFLDDDIGGPRAAGGRDPSSGGGWMSDTLDKTVHRARAGQATAARTPAPTGAARHPRPASIPAESPRAAIATRRGCSPACSSSCCARSVACSCSPPPMTAPRCSSPPATSSRASRSPAATCASSGSSSMATSARCRRPRPTTLVGLLPVGRIPAGTLLAQGMFADEVPLAPNEVVFGAALDPGEAPLSGVQVGAPVELLDVPKASPAPDQAAAPARRRSGRDRVGDRVGRRVAGHRPALDLDAGASSRRPRRVRGVAARHPPRRSDRWRPMTVITLGSIAGSPGVTRLAIGLAAVVARPRPDARRARGGPRRRPSRRRARESASSRG